MKMFKATFVGGKQAQSFISWLMSNLGDFTVELLDDYSWSITVTRISMLACSGLGKEASKCGAVFINTTKGDVK